MATALGGGSVWVWEAAIPQWFWSHPHTVPTLPSVCPMSCWGLEGLTTQWLLSHTPPGAGIESTAEYGDSSCGLKSPWGPPSLHPAQDYSLPVGAPGSQAAPVLPNPQVLQMSMPCSPEHGLLPQLQPGCPVCLVISQQVLVLQTTNLDKLPQPSVLGAGGP